MLLDSQGTSVLEDLRIKIKNTLSRDILNKNNDFSYPTKNPPGHHVLFLPNSLEKLMKEAIGRSPDFHNHEEKNRLMKEFLFSCQYEGKEIHQIWYRSIVPVLVE